MPGSSQTHQAITSAAGAGGGDVNIHDGVGNPLTSTVAGADQALDVNIVAGAGAGGTSMVDDAVFTPGVTAITPAGAMFDDAAPDSVDEGDGGVVRMSANRNLYVRIRDDAGNERGLNIDAAGAIAVTDGGGSLSVDDGGVSLSVDDAGLSLTVDDGGLALTVDNATISVVGGGAEATAQRVTIANDSTGILTVDGNVTADIRDGAGVALTSTLVGADQALDVNIVQTVGGAGGTSMVDDAVFTPATTQVTPIAGFADDAAPDSVDEGDAGAVRMSLNRNLNVRIRDDAGNERGLNIDAAGAIAVTDGGGALTVDNTVLSVVGGGAEATAQRVTLANDSTGVVTVDNTVLSVVGGGAEATAQRVTIANDSTGLLSVDDNAGSLTIDNAALSVVNGGVEATALRVTIANDSTGLLSVDDNAGSLTVDNATISVVGGGAEATAQRVTIANDSTGVLTVDGTVTAANAAGDIADDAVDSGNPVKIGGVAVETDGTDPTSVSAEGDRAEARTDRNRRLLVNTAHPNLWSTNDNYAAAQTDTEIKATPGANLSLYITDVTISVDAACNVTLVRNTAASADIFGPFYFAAKGGMARTFTTPIRVTANQNLGVTSSAAVDHTVSVQGYIAP